MRRIQDLTEVRTTPYCMTVCITYLARCMSQGRVHRKLWALALAWSSSTGKKVDMDGALFAGWNLDPLENMLLSVFLPVSSSVSLA